MRTMMGAALLLAVQAQMSFGQPQSDKGSYGWKPVAANVKLPDYAPPNPTVGPPDIYVYKNSVGTFKLAKGNGEGSAKYSWGGQMNNDKLEFLGFGQLTDSTGVGLPAGQVSYAWIYKATDAAGGNPANFIYFAFAIDPLTLPNVQGTRYAFYYSPLDPRLATTKMNRVLLPDGTKRE